MRCPQYCVCVCVCVCVCSDLFGSVLWAQAHLSSHTPGLQAQQLLTKGGPLPQHAADLNVGMQTKGSGAVTPEGLVDVLQHLRKGRIEWVVVHDAHHSW